MCIPGRINPTGELFFDGVTLSAYDVLFVKMKSLMLAGKTSGTTKALQYQSWMDAAVMLTSLLLLLRNWGSGIFLYLPLRIFLYASLTVSELHHLSHSDSVGNSICSLKGINKSHA